MATRAAVDAFLAEHKLAVVGVSRSGRGFGNMAVRELRGKGYEVFPINPNSPECFPSLQALPERPGGVLIVVPPQQTEQVVSDAAAAGITHVWIQQGAVSDSAVHFCDEHGITAVAGECILMYAAP